MNQIYFGIKDNPKDISKKILVLQQGHTGFSIDYIEIDLEYLPELIARLQAYVKS